MTACRLAAILPGSLIIRDPRAAKPLQLVRVGDDTARAVASVVRVLGPVDVVRESA